MKQTMMIISLFVWSVLTVSADLLVYEGFNYGDLTNFEHNTANSSAAGGTGLSTSGWRQYNATVSTAGLVETSAGSYAPSWLDSTNGYMKINGGGAGNTWAFRSLASPIATHVDTTYYFSFVLRNQDSSGISTDGAKLVFRAGDGSTILYAGFTDTEALCLKAGSSSQVNGSTLFDSAAAVTLVGKVTLSASGSDTVSVSAFTGASGPGSEPVSWDLTSSAEFNWWQIAELGLNVNGGNSEVDFDEIRLGTTFDDVLPIPEPATLGLLGIGAAALWRLKVRR
ncbi:MAG: PEP-CTERM sorting domain-containing protein [Kiritimatiellales bacterium]